MLTPQQVEQHAIGIAAEFKDGVQVSDLFVVVPRFMEIVEDLEDMKGPEKQKLAIALIEKFLDLVDLPGPDVVVKPILKKFLPHVIDLVANASAGLYEINV
jgi:hypothetical protein